MIYNPSILPLSHKLLLFVNSTFHTGIQGAGSPDDSLNCYELKWVEYTSVGNGLGYYPTGIIDCSRKLGVIDW